MEGGRSSDERVRKALRPLAGFGLVHAAHEWLEMFAPINTLTGGHDATPLLSALQLATLSFSFLSLAAFGGYLLAKDEVAQRVSLLIPLGLEGIWIFGIAVIKGNYPFAELFDAAHAWTRYSLAIPASILASAGLIAQQRAFRRVGLVRFGQDAMWAAIAFAWYGIFGQLFTNSSALPPSTFINEQTFLRFFGFPIQLLRAFLAGAAAIYVIRFLRAFQVETEQKIAALQEQQLKESQQRETMRGELFRRVVAAQESERQRIARDLHDETGQALTAIGLGLRGLEGRLARDPKQAADTLHELQTLAADSLKELQSLMTDLRPSHLDDLGLSATLRWYAGKVAERYPLKVKVEIIIKHADAKNASIGLNFDERGIRVDVRDDGHGFDLDHIKTIQSSSRPSLGLAGMQERAALLGGTMTIQSRPGQGTSIEVFIPYSTESEKQDEHKPSAGG
ncbi:MAG: sensor histidine kinase, partial [Chloroflexi bacterium]|nr:sensor histidine kinase [Chloroflexota bacterium]